MAVLEFGAHANIFYMGMIVTWVQCIGISPFNRNIFSESDYTPGHVTDRPQPSDTQQWSVRVSTEDNGQVGDQQRDELTAVQSPIHSESNQDSIKKGSGHKEPNREEPTPKKTC